jgi:hypothetical protein
MDILFSGVKLDVDKYIFPWQMCCFGGHFLLESSCNWVNTVYIIYIYIYIYARARACYTYCAISVSECTLQ